MCKCCEVKCFPDKKTILKCGSYKFTYYSIFVIQNIFSFLLYFFDIGSDIYVLVDLYNNDYAYFNLCLVIVLLPTTSTTFEQFSNINKVIDHDKKTSSTKGKCNYIYFCIREVFTFIFFFVSSFIFNALQLLYCASCMGNINQGSLKGGMKQVKYMESLLESAPQALFQLFIILKNSHSYDFNQKLIYYSSISLSILSLIYGVISFEVFYVNYDRGWKFCRMRWLNQCSSSFTDYTTPFNILYKKIKYNTKYVLLLTCYRLTEFFSRIGLLACIGIIYNGYFIIWFLIGDFLILSFLKSFKSLLNCDLFEYELILNEEDRRWKIPGSNCSLMRTVFINMRRIIDTIKSLPIYHLPFFTILIKDFNETRRQNETFLLGRKNPILYIDFKKEREKYYSGIKYHFISRHLNNLILSILIIINLSTNAYPLVIRIISIVSITFFGLNIPLSYYIMKCVFNYKIYYNMFTPIKCCKCKCKCNWYNSNKVTKGQPEEKHEIDEKEPQEIII